MLEFLTVKDAYLVLLDGVVVKNSSNALFKMRNKKVWVKCINATYTLSFDDFLELYKDEKFIIFDDNDVLVDSKKDEEYYSFKHK